MFSLVDVIKQIPGNTNSSGSVTDYNIGGIDIMMLFSSVILNLEYINTVCPSSVYFANHQSSLWSGRFIWKSSRKNKHFKTRIALVQMGVQHLGWHTVGKMSLRHLIHLWNYREMCLCKIFNKHVRGSWVHVHIWCKPTGYRPQTSLTTDSLVCLTLFRNV